MLTHKFPNESRVHTRVCSGVEHLHPHSRLELALVRMGTVKESGVLGIALDHPTLQEELHIRQRLHVNTVGIELKPTIIEINYCEAIYSVHVYRHTEKVLPTVAYLL